MKAVELALLSMHFARTRWGLNFCNRASLEAWQNKRIKQFLATQLPRAPFYRRFAGNPLEQLPIVDKSTMLAHFAQMNQAGITLDEATSVALGGEASREFAPSLCGITVGLSSGTQGSRGVFLVSSRERAKWAGIMLARALPSNMIRAMIFGGMPIKVAFFLRANSNLYTTLKSKRVDFRFYDLFDALDAHWIQLEQHQPDILVAPARILGRIAELVLAGEMKLSPRRVIAVAEVLEPDDKQRIEQAFGIVVHQLYQCTEGFLGYTCEHGTLHLNEEFVHIEPEWVDAEKTRFVPVVTDFSRTTQLIVRYRLNDILRMRKTPCPCGRASMALAAVEGRSDDVLWLPTMTRAALAPLYPDMVRHAVTSAPGNLPDYRIEQHGIVFQIAVADNNAQSYEAIVTGLRKLLSRHGMSAPSFRAIEFVDTDFHVKRRRIVCKSRPTLALVPD